MGERGATVHIQPLPLFPKEEICCFCRVAQTRRKKRGGRLKIATIVTILGTRSALPIAKILEDLFRGQNFRRSRSLNIKCPQSKLRER